MPPDGRGRPGENTETAAQTPPAPTDQVRTQSNGQARQGYGATPIDELLEVLGATDGEFFAVCSEDKTTGRPFASSVMAPSEVAASVAKLSPTADVWFSVCPTAGPARTGEGRGGTADVTRLSAVFTDLDIKQGGCPDMQTAWAIVIEMSNLLGVRPAAAVYSGHGLQPLWPITDGAIGEDFTNAAAASLLNRFGRLVAAVAETFRRQGRQRF